MGCCSSLTAAELAELNDSKRFDHVLKDTREQDTKIIKLLLLGTGESGKSTIFKQMQILYEEAGFSEIEKKSFRHVLRRNVLDCMQTLLMGCQRLEIPFQNPQSEASARALLTIDPLLPEFWADEIVKHTKLLWQQEPAMKEVYKQRAKLQLLDSASYFFEHIDRFAQENFTPTPEDILRARLRTSGIVERTFYISDVPFKFLDVGGQRNERRKWIHCFEDVTAVLFVTAISEFDQTLYEDEKENRLHESLKVFESVINNRFFTKSTIILMMNKMDLFKEKLAAGAKLTEAFPDYPGPHTFEAVSDFIRERFLELSEDKNRMIFAHLTCATDTQNVQKVFDACKLTILNENLNRLGLS